ncbi:MAG: hypothetical protein LBK02_08895 [Treponema sp.]|nr:hypothetical protein [Treponema sp.]
MFNIKWSAIAGGFGLALSLLVGIISGAGFPMVLIRALVFGLVFFVLAGLVWLLINNCIPELLYSRNEDEGSGKAPGSRVDISLGDEQESALPEMYRNSGSGDEVDNITDMINGKTPVNNTGMDQNGEDDYTQKSGTGLQAESPEELAGIPGASSGGYDPGEGLPSLDSMSAAFGPSTEEPVELQAEDVSIPVSERHITGNKPQSLKGDFNPKELAAAIRTKISKE